MSQPHIETLISEHDGLKLSVAFIIPDGEPKALVQFSHGMAEHKERYFPLMSFLADHGYACVINDHRGHGASVKTLQDLGYFYKDGGRGLIADLKQINTEFKKRFPGKKCFMVGHSMGSFAAREFASRYGSELNGVVLSGSPGFNPTARFALLIIRLLTFLRGGDKATSRLMDKLTTGAFGKHFPASPCAWLSTNADNVAAYEADPLCGFGFTLNGYRALMHLMIAAYDENNRIRRSLPIHFMSGEDDPCARDANGFQYAVENIRKRDCAEVTSKVYPGLRHEIFNEGKQEVLNDLLEVLDRWQSR